ncbi:TPA: hypothetical protein ACX6NV_000575 [Photobacterium damselae]
MKYVFFSLLAVLMSFNAFAISTSTTTHTGVTTSNYNGGSSGVESRSSVLHSVTAGPGIVSVKHDQMRGVRYTANSYDGTSLTAFVTVTDTFNAAQHVVGSSVTVYNEEGSSVMRGAYRERGFTHDVAVTPAGVTVLNTRYAGSYREFANSDYETNGLIVSTFESWQ